MGLPHFKYHRDPVRSESIRKSGNTCKCCGQARGYIYAGPVYAQDDLDEAICPWCIADGSAHRKFDASFVDEAALPDDLPESVVEEVAWRTPGYCAWQSEQWFSCCEDAVMFLEPAGISEVRERYRELEGTILGNIIYDLQVSGGAAMRMLESLRRNTAPTAFIFQCTRCGRYKTFVDGVFSTQS